MAARPIIASAWLKPDYRAALEAAGATVKELSPTDDLPAALADCDGLMLTGGADVDPAEYRDAERHPTLELDPARDRYELALARHALAHDLPTLAICRGAQVLNVAAGGTLIQDIPSSHPEALNHQQTQPKDLLSHPIQVVRDSCLGALMVADVIDVNSRHHQAIREVAPGFETTATAPDGIIEAIEKPGATFCVGVQWHPENFHATGRFAVLFNGLVTAAMERKSGRS